MDYQSNQQPQGGAGGHNSLYSASSDRNYSPSSTPISGHHNASININTNNNQQSDPMQSWWESVSKARSRIHSLLALLPSDFSPSDALAESDHPARSLLESPDAYAVVSSSLASPASGSGDDPLCHWLYDTFQSSDSDLRLVVLSFVPLLTGLYLSRLHLSSSVNSSAPSLAGFEAVLLALYASETISRAGKPLLVSIPDLSQPSLYHNPSPSRHLSSPFKQSVKVLSPPLEPQLAIKSTKRGCVVGVALGLYYKHISQMPNWSKIELCRFATSWAGVDCPCARSLDPVHDNEFEPYDQEDSVSCTAFENEERSDCEINNVVDDTGNLDVQQDATIKGLRIPIPWEMLQSILRILGHCLLAPLTSQEIRNEAGVAVRRLYARASHDLFPQGILATRSLIGLDNRACSVAETVALRTNSSSNVNTPSKSKKPEVLLVSK